MSESEPSPRPAPATRRLRPRRHAAPIRRNRSTTAPRRRLPRAEDAGAHRGVLHGAAAIDGSRPLGRGDRPPRRRDLRQRRGAVRPPHRVGRSRPRRSSPRSLRNSWRCSEAEVPGGAWAVERAGGFGHEPCYVPRWPVPDDTTVDVVDALVAQPAVKLMLRHDRLQRGRAAVGRARGRGSPGGVQPLELDRRRCSRSAPPA